DHERRRDRALLAGQADAAHTLAATALTVELVELGALAVPGLGHDQDRAVVAGDVARHHGVLVVLELHAAYAGRAAAHRAYVVLAEADRHAVATDHEDVVAAAGLDHLDQLVAVAQVDRDQSVAPARVVLVERRLLDGALLRGE